MRSSTPGSPADVAERLTATVGPRSGDLGRLCDDPLIDLGDQTALLGCGQERQGRDQLAGAIDHAQQQLLLDDAAGRQLDDRL